MKTVNYLILSIVLISFAHALDENSDGISDIYVSHYGLLGTDPTDDLDGDGYTNLIESMWGFDPLDPDLNPALQFSLIGNAYDIFIPTVSGKRYEFHGTNNLQIEWYPIDEPFDGTGNDEHLEVTLPIGNADRYFWRVQLLPDVDEDRDRLSAYEEHLLGTSDTKKDSDDDEVSDADEFIAGLNPNSNVDANNNNVPDDWEQFHGVENLASDSDGDGLADGAEFTGGTSPTDFFNGDTSFVIEMFDSGIENTFSARVLDAPNGQPVANAPVKFKAILGEHTLSSTPAGVGQQEIDVRTNLLGVARAYIIRE